MTDRVLARLRQVAREEFGVDPMSVLLTNCDEVAVNAAELENVADGAVTWTWAGQRERARRLRKIARDHLFATDGQRID